MIFVLEQNPQDLAIAYDDLSVGYALASTVEVLTKLYVPGSEYALGIDDGDLYLEWCRHSRWVSEWVFTLGAHLLAEYHYRTGLQCPGYLSALSQAKQMIKLASFYSESVKWWPLCNPVESVNVYELHNGPRRTFSPCETYKLCEQNHRLWYAHMSKKSNLQWTKRMPPLWLH